MISGVEGSGPQSLGEVRDKLGISFKTIETVLALNLQALEADGRTSLAQLYAETGPSYVTLMKLKLIFESRKHIGLKTAQEVGIDAARIYRHAFRPTCEMIYAVVNGLEHEVDKDLTRAYLTDSIGLLNL